MGGAQGFRAQEEYVGISSSLEFRSAKYLLVVQTYRKRDIIPPKKPNPKRFPLWIF